MIKRLCLVAGLAVLVLAGFYLVASSSHLKRGGSAASPPGTGMRSSAGTARVATQPGIGPVKVAPNGTNSPRSRDMDLAINPYAAALREPGKAKRAWDPDFLKQHQDAAIGQAIRFELTDGQAASGTIRILQQRGTELVYMSGDLTEPEAGRFFFLTPPSEGKAGKAVGVVEFPVSHTAYRIEPTGPGGAPELWRRRLDEVICQDMPRAAAGAAPVRTNVPAEMPPLRPDSEAIVGPSYNSNIVSLQSYPGSSAVLLLDFFGGYTPTWGGIAYSKPANVNNTTIKDLWKRVAEDYMPFNINVTTDIKVYQAAPANSRQRCCFTDTPVTAAGVAYVGSWNWGSDTPCWSVYTTGKNGAEVGAHEPGHTLGLSHQTQDIPNGTNAPTHVEYFTGQGSGAVGWAPIMGVGYYQPVSTWAKGEYQYAGNTQDALAIITSQNNNVTYRADDTGSTLATSRYLELFPDSSASAEGVIERTGDTDAFQFTTTGGQVTLTANAVADWADLALMATLADASDTIIASNNPQSVLSATISSNLPAGTYTFRVTGAGRNDPFLSGFSAYASLGYYSVAGWVSGGRLPTRLSVLEHSPNGTVVGAVPASSSTNLLAYAIVSGNTGGSFSVDANGTVLVANNTLLDYNRLATNTVFPVQFELLINITNLDLPELTELGRRVVIAVLKSGANYPIAVTGYNAGVISPCNATASVPKATGFDIPNNYCFYEAGLNGNPQAGGSGAQGLPPSGTVLSQVDGTTFQLGPYGGNNVLMLGSPYSTSGTLTLTQAQSYNSIAVLATSANGGGNGTFVVRFTNGTSRSFSLYAQDWYNTTTNVALQGFGRLKLGQGTLSTENPGWDNPNFYQTTVNLAALGLNLPVASVSFAKPGASGNSGVFAVSGALMPAAVSIAQQPQSATNVFPAASATFSVVAMGTAPLSYNWYFSTNGIPGTFAPLDAQTSASLTLNPVLDPTNAGFFYAVVTNTVSAVTSSVAALTIYRAPVIASQPAPANLVLLSGASSTFSVTVNAALPIYYYWRTNGAILPGANAATLTLADLQVSSSASYDVLVSNTFGMVTSSVVALTVLAPPSYPYAQRVLTDHPISYWRLDEASGSVAYDCYGGNNGIYNKVLLGQPGYNLLDTHKAARFGSLASANSQATNMAIDFATAGSATFSIEAWVNGGAQSGDSGLVTKGTGSGGEQFNLDCGGSSHAFRFFVRDIAGNAHLATSSVVPNSKWHHLLGVCDQVHSNVVLYVDGANAAQGSIIPGSGILSSSNSVSIGSRQSGGNTAYDLQFTGYMEEVAIYNYALSAAQAQAHFITASNRPPVFALNPFTEPDANAGQTYSATIATNATDPNGDAVTFRKVSGPSWLNVAFNGGLSGLPFSIDAGTNSFVVSASDPAGLSASATLLINVTPAPSIVAALSVQGTNLWLNWSGGIAPYQIQTKADISDLNWQDYLGQVSSNSLIFSPSNAAGFYRILGQ